MFIDRRNTFFDPLEERCRLNPVISYPCTKTLVDNTVKISSSEIWILLLFFCLLTFFIGKIK